MILGLEIALVIMGLMALIRGKMKMGKNREVTGIPARLLGLVGLLPMPMAIVLNIGYVAMLMASGELIDPATYTRDHMWAAVGIEAGCALGCALFMCVVGAILARPPVPVVDPFEPEVRTDDDLEDPPFPPRTNVTDRPRFPRQEDRI
jgi:hypothetical protein